MAAAEAQVEYEHRQTESRAVEQRFDAWSAAFGHGRVLLTVVGLGLVLVAYGRGQPQPTSVLLLLGGLVIGTLVGQAITDGYVRIARLRTSLYTRGLDRLAGRWRTFPSQGLRFLDSNHPYASDLDVLGQSSLFQLLDTTRTAQGESTLAQWLLDAAAIPEIHARQAATRALSGDLDGRETLALAGADEELSRIDERPLTKWAEGPMLFTLASPLIWVARILPFATVTLGLLSYSHLIPWWPVAILAVIHFGLLRHVQPGIAALGPVAEHAERMLSRLVPLIEAAQGLSATAPRIQELVGRLSGAGESIAALKRRVTFFQSRANMFVAVISPVVFWDIHAALMLQSWQRRTGGKLRQWFADVGELEALAAFATYAYENPADVWPTIVESGLVLAAHELGHPLLPVDHCVRNDLQLKDAGTAILITGSNMSGKSTLLRAVGLNTVMALAGLPVRAGSLTVPLVQVATVMRVSDSLQEGASFFLAEVKRLKRVVDLAGGDRPLLFLLDEILQGTNTRERSLGAQGVVANLLERHAFGLVSTHDLSLVQLGEAFGERLRFAHFTDQVEGDRMTFDYRIKEGVVRTSNALRLMRAMGLEVEIPSTEKS